MDAERERERERERREKEKERGIWWDTTGNKYNERAMHVCVCVCVNLNENQCFERGHSKKTRSHFRTGQKP